MGFLRVYRRVLGLLARDRTLAAALALASVLLAALHFAEPILFGRVVDVLAAAPGRPAEETWRATLGLLAVWAALGLGGIAANILVALHADRLAHRNRLAAMQRFFEHALALPLAFHGDVHSGRLLKVMLQGADHLFGLWLAFFREHLETFVTVLVLLPLTLLLNWRLASLLLVLVAVFAALTALVVRRTEQAQAAVERHHSELAASASDALANVVVVQSFVRREAEAQSFSDTSRRVLAAQFPVLNWWALVSVLTRGSSTVAVLAIFVLGTWLALRGEATVGDIVSFMGFATILIGRLEHAVGFTSRLFFQLPALREYFEVLDARSSVAERPNALALPRVRGEVEFERVSFGYGSGRLAVAELDLRVAPGSTVALVGQTGAGKSTAMSLLHRAWDPSAGAIRIDGVDLRDATLDSLRQNIGVVFQDSLLFYRSIAENLRVGKPDATQGELEAAARMAEAHEFILRQPRGYETLVGERGSTLSGGERQRLAIARALLKDPPILILDEATSALDAATEARVQRALATLMRGRTTFVIAHRLSTVRDADLILVFDQGRVVERGPFAELVARGGVFARLVATQLAPSGPQPGATAGQGAPTTASPAG
jgi:ATP-binding cassette subfamily B protein